jgi:signal transduction histidine kinase
MDVSLGLEELQLALQRAEVERAVTQGKFELAAEILHDIGNAVVGFGSYLMRQKRSLEQYRPDNLVNLAAFISARQSDIGKAIGEAKAAALGSMVQSILESSVAVREEFQRSVGEQLKIISHVQEILNIQRQYVAGHESTDRRSVNLRGVIEDCLSMIFASIEKREIHVTKCITAESPVVQGSQTRLMQVVMNVLKNSIEAIDRNEGEKREKAIGIHLFSEKDLLIFEVRDTGAGFDEATGARLFSRGFTTRSTGTGLGLYNCRTILEGHAATIIITSGGPGKGALTEIKFKI